MIIIVYEECNLELRNRVVFVIVKIGFKEEN